LLGSVGLLGAGFNSNLMTLANVLAKYMKRRQCLGLFFYKLIYNKGKKGLKNN